jgi:hypothetical protein
MPADCAVQYAKKTSKFFGRRNRKVAEGQLRARYQQEQEGSLMSNV